MTNRVKLQSGVILPADLVEDTMERMRRVYSKNGHYSNGIGTYTLDALRSAYLDEKKRIALVNNQIFQSNPAYLEADVRYLKDASLIHPDGTLREEIRDIVLCAIKPRHGSGFGYSCPEFKDPIEGYLTSEENFVLDNFGDPQPTIPQKLALMARWVKGAGGEVATYYNRDKKAVFIHFPKGDGKEGLQNIQHALATELEERGATQAKYETQPSNYQGFSVSMPAQVYIYKLGGIIPGLERSR